MMVLIKMLRSSLVVSLPLLGLVSFWLGWWGCAALLFAAWIIYLKLKT